MDFDKLVGKIAADKNSKKLGRIIKIEAIEDTKTKSQKLNALILVKKFLLRDIVILIDLDKYLKSTEQYVWFNILKEEFEQEVVETRALMNLYK